MKISKKLIFNIAFLVWIVFSVIYIAYDFWSDFKAGQLARAYQQGRVDTINELIRRAQKCEPFPVFSGETEVNLIDINCLQRPETQE